MEDLEQGLGCMELSVCSPPTLIYPFFTGSAIESQFSATWTLRSSPTATKEQASLNFWCPRPYKAGRRNLECHPTPEVKKKKRQSRRSDSKAQTFASRNLGMWREAYCLCYWLGFPSSQHLSAPRTYRWLDPGKVDLPCPLPTLVPECSHQGLWF